MKEVFITYSQKELLEKLIIEENTAPAAQDQVNKKVNSGIMDAVAGGAMFEGAEPESTEYKIGIENNSNLGYAHILENKNEEEFFQKAINSILRYIETEGLKITPYPDIEFNWDDQDGLFITTGYYLPSDKKIVLFCKDRHPKDVLRSYCHELIHHKQNLEGKNMNFGNQDDVKDNKELEALEAEAYLEGNIFFRKWTEYEKNNKNILAERILSVSELRDLTKGLDEGERWTIYAPMVDESLEPDEIDLSSFNIKHKLNPKFWKNGKLDSRIRLKLLDIADDFIDFLGVDWVKPQDIIITGSLANFNWNHKHSDIDLHIILDYSKVDKRVDFVSNYFYSQKKIWNEEHRNLKIYGFPIEVYVQDVNEKHNSSGVYSLEKNEWIEEPVREKIATVKVNKEYIKYKVSKYTEKIDKLVKLFEKYQEDDYKLKIISKKAEELFDIIKTNRRESLNVSDNEITEENIIFKCLRRLKYIEKLLDIISLSYDKLNSLP